MTDFVVHIHDTHHPIAGSLYYEEQIPEAKRRAEKFHAERLPRFMHYFERVLPVNPAGGGYMVGDRLSYVDLSMFQLLAGLRYAFPQAMKKLEPALPLLTALGSRVEALPRISTYLQSKRRLPFNQQGIFRRYPELDLQPSRAAKPKSKSTAKQKVTKKPVRKAVSSKAKAKKK